ncbi:MAG: gluconate 2-dehydrogenase subunit 3 family protein [Deltaproteobacteria bacterium]|nr:gluconate 2-dehydrogenase subunit 3 family protein [Deltaproteobacteria bacterium]
MEGRATLEGLRVDLTRRRLLRTGLGGALLLGFGAVLPSGCARYSPVRSSLRFLTRKEYAVVTQAAVRILGLPDEERERLGGFIDGLLADLPPTSQSQARLMLRVVEHGTHLFDLKPRRFTRLSPAEQDAYLRGWMESTLGARRVIFRALKTLAALGYYAQPSSFASIGYDGPWLGRIEATVRVAHEAPVDLATVLAERQAS